MKVVCKFLVGIILMVALLVQTQQVGAQIVHNISTASLIIPATSSSNYIIKGVTLSNYIEVEAGYKGTITLQNVTISLKELNSPMDIKGQNNCSNMTPVTKVDLVLEGSNSLIYTGKKGCSALQVEQGAQVNISAITTSDNASGILNATVTNDSGGAGIGALDRFQNSNESTSISPIIGYCNSPATTAGGNIVISSGTVNAHGGHGAGMGGGYMSFYDGMVIIYGGVVNSTSYYHAAGIGSGCPTGGGVVPCFTPNSSIIVLPPSQVTASGSNTTGNDQNFNLGLAGANDIVYIGDPKKPQVTVRTVDFEPNARIYVDLSQDPSISKAINAVVAKTKLDINKVQFGTTNDAGLFQFNGLLQNNTTFFTDANSSNPATLGRPYMPENTILTAGGEVVLKLLPTNLSLLPYPSSTLELGYSAADARRNAYWVKLQYTDPMPMTNVVVDLASGTATHFEYIQFYAADSVTAIATPVTLNQGDVYYISIPIKVGKPTGVFNDVLRIIGTWNGTSTTHIRQIIKQEVVRTLYVSDCPGKFLFNNNFVTKSGIYRDTLTTVQGGDSIVELHFTAYPVSNKITTATICSNQLYTFRSKTYNTPGLHSDTLRSVYNCDSIFILDLKVYPAQYKYDTVSIVENQLPYVYGDTIFQKGSKSATYIFRKQTALGCDDLKFLTLKVLRVFSATINNLLSVCGDNQNLIIDYGLVSGLVDWHSVLFDEKAHLAGFKDVTHLAAKGQTIAVDLPLNVPPNFYNATVVLENNDAFIQKFPLKFSVNYPASIVIQKWNDVLALLNSDYNGGYELQDFQWYKNGQLLPGENKSYLYIANGSLDVNAVYTVAVTRKSDGIRMMTCPIAPIQHAEVSIYPSLVSKGQKIVINMNAAAKVTFWNVSGLKVLEHALSEGPNSIQVPNLTGTYLLDIITVTGDRKKQMVIVK